MESPYKGETVIKRLISATRNSLAGLTAAVRRPAADSLDADHRIEWSWVRV